MIETQRINQLHQAILTFVEGLPVNVEAGHQYCRPSYDVTDRPRSGSAMDLVRSIDKQGAVYPFQLQKQLPHFLRMSVCVFSWCQEEEFLQSGKTGLWYVSLSMLDLDCCTLGWSLTFYGDKTDCLDQPGGTMGTLSLKLCSH
jgi:hypothetical protein